MFHRLINLPKLNSFFLFGARGTGKSTLLRQHFSGTDALWLDLLDPELESLLSRDPSSLASRWRRSKTKWIVIDEVQKVPKLLDVVHSMIEKEKVKFALTGSSARKLKRGQANLLAGRAWSLYLYPLSVFELGQTFELESALKWGTLPGIFSFTEEPDKRRFLTSYVNTYLKEEILIEQIVRAIEPFRKFLPVAAHSHGRPMSFSKVGRDAGIDPKSVERYFSILEDTLVGSYLDSFHTSVRKRQKLSPKFYFFDVGVQRALAETLDVLPVPRTSYYGEMFESFLISEIMRMNSYLDSPYKLSYLQTHDGLEVDLILEKAGKVVALVEIKSSTHVESVDLQSLRRLKGDFPKARRMCLCQQTAGAIGEEGIEILPWLEGIRELFPNLKA